MTREEYSQHKEDYDNRQLSGGAFVLFQETYIATIEAHLKAKEEEIERLKVELKHYKELASELDNELRNVQWELSDLKDNQ